MSDFDPQVADAFRQMTEDLRQVAPEIVDVMDRAKRGDITEAEAMAEMVSLYATNPHISALVMDAARQHLTPLSMPEDQDIGGAVVATGRRPRLNPLFEAALIERAQFDGDIPELRTGPLPVGSQPAVPVETRVRNPVALGTMLTEASQRVQRALAGHEQQRRQRIEELAEGNETTALLQQGTQALVPSPDPDFGALVRGSGETDLPEYRRGQVPAPVQVEPPAGSALLALTPQQRREAAWRFFGTTQGRRSAIASIRELVATNLRGAGFEVVERDFEPHRKVSVLGHHEWTTSIADKGALQPSFNVIVTAAKALSSILSRVEDLPKRVVLEVVPVDTVDVRSVGWAARLVAE